jgi:ABC-type bacteriocin/lantibiotic exporter with double-glycine peptidase domain
MKNNSFKLILLFFPFFFCGCASFALDYAYKELVVNRKLTEEDINSDNTYILDIPFKEQTQANCCGLVCLSMVLEYWTESPFIFNMENIDCPEKGFSGKELKEIAIAKGYNAFIYKGDLADIYKNLSLTRPVIVILRNLGSNHYVVVSGYSQDGKLIVNNPSEGRMFYDPESFMNRWEKANYFSFLVLPKSS